MKAGMMTRHMGDEVIDGSFIAGEEIAFGAPVALNPAGDPRVVRKYGGSYTYVQGFAVRDGGSFKRTEDGTAVEKLSYQAGDPVAVAKKGVIALAVSGNVTMGKKVALTSTGGIVDETASGAAVVLTGAWFRQSGSSGDVVEVELNLPAYELSA